MIVYIEVSDDNRIQSWSSSYYEGTIELEIEDAEEGEEPHPMLNSPLRYLYIDGELIREESHVIKLTKKERFEELSRECENEILGYFEGTVNSVPYLFSFDREAQSNFTGTLALFTEGAVSHMEWTAWKDGKAERIILDKQQFMKIVATAFNHKNSKISRLRGEIQEKLDEATTIEEIESVVW